MILRSRFLCTAGLYYPPKEGDRTSHVAYIDSLPATPLPEAIGLHANADIAKVWEGKGGCAERQNGRAERFNACTPMLTLQRRRGGERGVC